MAGVFKEAVLTAKGIALLAKAQAGRCTIKLTKAGNRRRIIFRWRSTHKQNCSQIQEAGVRLITVTDPEPVQCICEIYHHK